LAGDTNRGANRIRFGRQIVAADRRAQDQVLLAGEQVAHR
jgi:hypothetical protein